MTGPSTLKIAWIGLGQMGLPTAKTVAAAGHQVHAFDVRAPAPDDAEGLVLAPSPRDAARDCDLLCIAVFSDNQVNDVLHGPEGVIDLLKPGTIVAVFTTGSIESIQAIAANAPPGVAILDTCFSRMQSEMASGKLTLLVGGDADAIERGRPAFDTFARAIVHVGGSGAGRAIKFVNNILFAGHLQLAADALRLAQGLGLDRASTAAALVQCSGASDILGRFANEDPAFMLKNAHRYLVKDVSAAIAAGHKAGVEPRALAAATATYLAQ
jgi:3-hydroxyisobutyrate dehydrogenase-like beta-hydroxyacid dehydrogenase